MFGIVYGIKIDKVVLAVNTNQVDHHISHQWELDQQVTFAQNPLNGNGYRL